MYPDAYYMNMTDGPDRNISVMSDTPAQVNTTLWKYNLSDDLAYGKTLIKLETEAVSGSTVDFTFTGIPFPGDDRFVLTADDNTVKTVHNGGTLSWSYSDWSTRNFTVTYRKETEADGDTGTPTSVPPDHCWTGSTPPFTRTDPTTGLTGIEIDTVADITDLCLDIRVGGTLPDDLPSLDNVYRYYAFTPSRVASDDITAVTLTFAVDAGFAEQYDEMVMSRYDGAWTALPTDPASRSGDRWEYEATTDGFSAFAVHGVDEPEPAEPETDDTAEAKAVFDTSIVSTNMPVDAGDPLIVNANITNIGEAAGTQDVTLDVDGIGTDSVSVTLAPGEWTVETFQWDTGDDDAGNYTATIGSVDTTAIIDVTVGTPGSAPSAESPFPTRIWYVLAVLLVAALGVAVYTGYPRWKRYRLERALLALSERAREQAVETRDRQVQRQLVDTLTRAEQAVEDDDLDATEAYIEELRQLLEEASETRSHQ